MNNNELEELEMEDIPVEELSGAVVMAGEPIEGYMPDDIRKWLEMDDSEERLASAMAAAHNKMAWLGHVLDDEEYSEEELERKEEEYNAWRTLEMVLIEEISKRLENENAKMGTRHITKGIGTYYIVKPFMERNDFIDGHGWWVKQS